MRLIAVLAMAVAAALPLGGCALFESDEADPPAQPEAVPAETYAPVQAVRDIEIGRTRDGYVITAIGIAPGIGYSAPELRPRRDGRPGPDGILDFDFVCRAPDPNFNFGEGDLRARLIRADRLLQAQDLQGAHGIRIHGTGGGLQMNF